MSWYAASIVTAIIVAEGEQDHVPVQEAIYLIEADTEELAWKKSKKIGTSDEGAGSEGMRWCERPAITKFLGIRKLKQIFPPMDKTIGIDDATPSDGAEITNNYFEVDDLKTAVLLASGKRVTVSYVDDDSE